jgi:hypothetical protein
MLILTRKPSQSLSIHPHPTLDLGTPVEQLFCRRADPHAGARGAWVAGAPRGGGAYGASHSAKNDS